VDLTVAVITPDEFVLSLPAVTVAPDGVHVRVIAAPAMALLLQSVTVTVIVAVSGFPEALIDAMSVVSLVFRPVSTVTLALDVPSEKPDFLAETLISWLPSSGLWNVATATPSALDFPENSYPSDKDILTRVVVNLINRRNV
jgi:hypothetical protein